MKEMLNFPGFPALPLAGESFHQRFLKGMNQRILKYNIITRKYKGVRNVKPAFLHLG